MTDSHPPHPIISIRLGIDITIIDICRHYNYQGNDNASVHIDSELPNLTT